MMHLHEAFIMFHIHNKPVHVYAQSIHRAYITYQDCKLTYRINRQPPTWNYLFVLNNPQIQLYRAYKTLCIKNYEKLTIKSPKVVRGMTRSLTTVIIQKALSPKLMPLAVVVVSLNCFPSILLVPWQLEVASVEARTMACNGTAADPSNFAA